MHSAYMMLIYRCMQLEVLNTLEKNDPDGRWHCVSLREWFNYRGHVCMAFEKLGLSLYDFLRRNAYNPFHVNMVRLHGRCCVAAFSHAAQASASPFGCQCGAATGQCSRRKGAASSALVPGAFASRSISNRVHMSPQQSMGKPHKSHCRWRLWQRCGQP